MTSTPGTEPPNRSRHIAGPSNFSADKVVPLVETPALQDTLARAAALARAHGHYYLGEEHLLEAILQGCGSVALAAIERAIPAETVRGHLTDILEGPGYNTPGWYPAHAHHAISAQCRAVRRNHATADAATGSATEPFLGDTQPDE